MKTKSVFCLKPTHLWRSRKLAHLPINISTEDKMHLKKENGKEETVYI